MARSQVRKLSFINHLIHIGSMFPGVITANSISKLNY